MAEDLPGPGGVEPGASECSFASGITAAVRQSVGVAVEVRDYSPADEGGWLQCRVLAFLGTSYFDDVVTEKPVYSDPSVELVATAAGVVVGVIDVSVSGPHATIETIAVDPTATRKGVASLLLDAVLCRLPSGVRSLDAWTRDDEAANRWYLSNGFRENFRYLHVYASDGEADAAITAARAGLTPVAAFFHADISAEEALRAEFKRVHICRQYLRPVASA